MFHENITMFISLMCVFKTLVSKKNLLFPFIINICNILTTYITFFFLK